MSAAPQLPRVVDARLPLTYEGAKQALVQCERIDECKEWKDKAAAMASYARMAKDDSLLKLSMRIQARAVERCGELLKQYDARPQNSEKQKDGTVLLVSQRQVAEQAGLSERERKTAVRVANVPKEEFEEMVESDPPATVTQIAERGKKTRQLVSMNGRDPKDYHASTHGQGALRLFVDATDKYDPAAIVRGAEPFEVAGMHALIDRARGWLARLDKEVSER